MSTCQGCKGQAIRQLYLKGGDGPASSLMAMLLRVCPMLNWCGNGVPAMEVALYETTVMRQFSGLGLARSSDEIIILNFRYLLQKRELAAC
ncbi:hypothetical protein B6S59_29825 [Pseudomonas sp. A46]|nr:hypothetical protein B6S59_29825 [Pseudomonas sp. A46]